MWVNLEDRDIAAVVEKFGKGAIADKLSAQPHPETRFFVEGAGKLDPQNVRLKVENDAAITRRKGGAWVQSWVWVTEKDAKVPPNLVGYDLSIETKGRVQALEKFYMEPIRRDRDLMKIEGEFGTHRWYLFAHKNSWNFRAHDNSEVRKSWLCTVEWKSEEPAFDMKDEDAMRCILWAFELFNSRTQDVGPDEFLYWREQLEMFIFKDLPLKELIKIFKVSADDVKRNAAALCGGETEVKILRDPSGALAFVGPGLKKIDVVEPTFMEGILNLAHSKLSGFGPEIPSG